MPIKKQIVAILILLIMVSQSSAVELIFSNDPTGIRLDHLDEYMAEFDINIENISIETINSSNRTFVQVSIPGFHRTLVEGAPQLPSMNRLLELPQGSDFVVSLLYSETETYNLPDLGFDAPVFPAQAPLAKNVDPASLPFSMQKNLYAQDHFLKQDQLTLTVLGHMRDANIGLLKIQPVEYNPVTGDLRIHHHMKISIDLTQADWSATSDEKYQKRTSVFSPLQRQITSLIPPNEDREDLVNAPIKMVIVSHNMFHDALQPFIQWKERQGFTIIEGYLGVDGLGTTNTAIENWLSDLYTSGTAEDPAPSFVLLVGDRAQVPAPNGSQGSHVTDRYYAEMTGDMLPDMYLGRFPAATVSQLENMLNKTLMYEQFTMSDPSYLNEVIMIAGMDGTYGPTHGNGQINYGTQQYFNPEHDILSHTYLYPTSGSSAAAIRADLSAGVALVNYTAHGSSTTWADPLLTIPNVNALTNSQKYCTAIANACLTAKFDTPECIGEAFLRAADKGAVGYIGGTNSTYWDEDYYWGVGNGPIVPSGASYEQTGWGMYDGLFHDHGEPESEWTITNSAMVYRGNLAVTESASSRANYYWEIYELFGDPSLMTYMGVPDIAPVNVPDAVVLGSSEIVVDAPAFSTVSLNQNDENITAMQADAFGIAVLTFDPTLLIPGVLDLVVTGQNFQPWFGEINVITPDGPYLIVDSMSLDDMSQGNGNGQADFGETLDLNFTLHNVGVDTARAIQGILNSADSHLSILMQGAPVNSLAPDSTVMQGPFTVTIGANCPNGYAVPLTLSLSAGLQSWTTDLELMVSAPDVIAGTILVDDDDNHRLDIGETTSLALEILNQGGCDLDVAQITLGSEDEYITLLDGPVILQDLMISSSQTASFGVVVDPATPVGHIISLHWELTGDQGYTAQGQFELTAGLVVEDFESGDFSAFDWELTGHADWLVQSQDIFEGSYASRSGTIGDNQNTNLSLILDVTGPGEIAFMYKVSSESSSSGFYDGLYFRIDGTLMGQWQGELPWSAASFPVDAGIHEFTWSYEKDGSVSHGSDCAWLDFVTMPPTSNAGNELGDINSDGQINIQDVVRIVNIILGQGADPTDLELFYADLNSDEMVDIGDLVSLVNIIIGGNLARSVNLTEVKIQQRDDQLLLMSDQAIVGLEIVYRGELVIDLPGYNSSQSESNAQSRKLIFSLDNHALPTVIPLIGEPGEYEILSMKVALGDGRVIDPELTRLPDAFALSSNYPNPFNPSTTIAYELPQTMEIRVTIYDLAGHNIWSYAESEKPAGYYSLVWNGLDHDGDQAASGVYLIAFTAHSLTRSTASRSEFRAVQKAVLIR